MLNEAFWKNKSVFLTGHTGFKGSWMCLLLETLGAKVTGYALSPPTDPSLFALCKINKRVHSIIGDVRNKEKLMQSLQKAKPDVVIHMAAQPLVIESYRNPVETFETNVMGTVNVLEAIRQYGKFVAFVNVTTDKCYENKEWIWSYKEIDRLGGHDNYSSSKACSELVTASYRNSFFQDPKKASIATARSGNVIGGGDWSPNRLIADCMKALLKGEMIEVRNPQSTRPWQHVLEPLYGYLLLGEKLFNERNSLYAASWNFGPHPSHEHTVEEIVKLLSTKWNKKARYKFIKEKNKLHEANYLQLDSTKSKTYLGWKPVWNVEQTIESIIEWIRAYSNGEDVLAVCLKQIEEFKEAIEV
jgi:CDP-glucose 4,6-dehydratase